MTKKTKTETKFKLEGPARFLPAKASDGIDAIIKDLEAVEANAKYDIDMSGWHDPILKDWDGINTERAVTGRCEVCLAGARLARLADDPDRGLTPSSMARDLGNAESDKIASLDSLRKGQLFVFLKRYENLSVTEDDTARDRAAALARSPELSAPEFVEYEDGREKFKIWLRWARDILEACGH